MAMFSKFLPLVGQLKAASRADVQRDVQAGLTTAVMLVPQGMAYAMLAGLPPIIGLYASVIPLVIYGLFGTSRQLAVGPVAMVSMLVAGGVSVVATPGTPEFVGFALLLALMVGVFQLGMGIARLGFLVNLLSHPVVSGFTSAAAIIIGLSQLQHVLGFKIPASHHPHEIVLHALEGAHQTHAPTVALALVSIGVLLALKRWNPRFPGALVVVVASSLVVWGIGLDQAGVRVVGTVPAGLPGLSVPSVDVAALIALLPAAITISLVGFMESVAVAKSFARRNRYEIDTNQELVGLGLANLGAAFTSGFPVTGGFSRTAVNAQAGATTSLAGIVTAAVVALTLLLLTPLFYYLPQAALAAIILTAVVGLIDVAEVRHLWHVDRADLALLALTFVITLLVGVEQGIGAGVAGSILWFVARNSVPHTAVLGRVRDDGVYRNVLRFPEARTFSGVIILRVDAPLFFANARHVKRTLEALESELDAPLTAVVLDMESVTAVDSSAVAMLDEALDDYQRRSVRLVLAGLRGPVRDALARARLTDRLGPGGLALRVDDAVRAVSFGDVPLATPA